MFIVVVNDYEKTPRLEYLRGLCSTIVNSNIGRYVFAIVHDKDSLKDNEPKRAHLHAFIDTIGKYTRRQFLSLFCEILELNLEQVSVDITHNPYLQVQYLIHKNDSDKYQYNVDDIFTNNNEELSKRLDSEYVDKDAVILDDIVNMSTFTAFTQKHGLEVAKKYLSIFKQIKTEQPDIFRNDRAVQIVRTLFRFFEMADRILPTNIKQTLDFDYYYDLLKEY